jgi:hypothetical protein
LENNHGGALYDRKALRWAVGAAALLGAVVLVVPIGPAVNAGEDPRQTLAVLPFEIKDTSGEVGGGSRHEAMLAGLTRYVARRVAASGAFDVLDEAHVTAAVKAADPGTYLRSCNGCEIDIAQSVGADAVMIGWFYKVSTLIGTLHVVVKEVSTGKVIYAHVFDFRGDNEKAWQRAASYMIEGLERRTKAEAPTTH